MAKRESYSDSKDTGSDSGTRKTWYKFKPGMKSKEEPPEGSEPDLEGLYFGSVGKAGLEEYKRTRELIALYVSTRLGKYGADVKDTMMAEK